MSPHTSFGFQLSRIPEPFPPSFATPKKSLLILPDSSVCVHHNSTSITLTPNSHATYSIYIVDNLTNRAHQFDPKLRISPFLSPQMSPGWHRIL